MIFVKNIAIETRGGVDRVDAFVQEVAMITNGWMKDQRFNESIPAQEQKESFPHYAIRLFECIEL